MHRKLINLEVNEVPPGVWIDFINQNPKSFIAHLFHNQKDFRLYQTLAEDVKKLDLYPSQTWASLHQGLPFDQHQVYWYSDKKDLTSYYWNQLSQSGISLGMVGSIHSSPMKRMEDLNTTFLIPDSFAENFQTVPEKYQNLQKMNLQLVKDSARKVSPLDILKHLFASSIWYSPSSFGLSPWSAKEIGKLLFAVLRGANLETMRNGQFPLMAQAFLDLCKKSPAQYMSFFTNHVAANMHRYWYAYRPQDFDNRLYGQDWVQRNKDNIPNALRLYDRFLEKIYRFCEKEDYSLCITTSMGQEANPEIDCHNTTKKFDVRLKDPLKFVRYCHQRFAKKDDREINVRLQTNMVPQYGFECDTEKDSRTLVKYMERAVHENLIEGYLESISGNTVTLSLTHSNESIHDEALLSEMGFVKFAVDDHHSGKHSPEGTLIILRDKNGDLDQCCLPYMERGQMDYLNWANVVKDFFDPTN